VKFEFGTVAKRLKSENLELLQFQQRTLLRSGPEDRVDP
jgi:hypothetical protein